MRQKSMGGTAFLIWICLASQSGAVAIQPDLACDFAAKQAAQNSGIPLSVMMSIARAESGTQIEGKVLPWPWTVNVMGEGYFFASKQEVVDFSDRLIQQGDINFDVGCFQVNLRWHSKGFSSLEHAFDPIANAQYAADFLSDLYQEKGNWADAVAAYHSRTPEHAERYLEKVQSIWTGLQETQEHELLGETPALVAPRVNTFPLLVSGQGTDGSIVPQNIPSSSKFGLP